MLFCTILITAKGRYFSHAGCSHDEAGACVLPASALEKEWLDMVYFCIEKCECDVCTDRDCPLSHRKKTKRTIPFVTSGTEDEKRIVPFVVIL